MISRVEPNLQIMHLNEVGTRVSVASANRYIIVSRCDGVDQIAELENEIDEHVTSDDRERRLLEVHGAG